MCDECCGCDGTDDSILVEDLLQTMSEQGVLESVLAALPFSSAQEARLIARVHGISYRFTVTA